MRGILLGLLGFADDPLKYQTLPPNKAASHARRLHFSPTPL